MNLNLKTTYFLIEIPWKEILEVIKVNLNKNGKDLMAMINAIFGPKISLEKSEIEIINEKILERPLSESLFQSIFSQTKTEDLAQNINREWNTQDTQLLCSKIELIRFRFFINDLACQIERISNSSYGGTSEPTKQVNQLSFQSVIVQLNSLPSMFQYKIEPPLFQDFIREQRKELIELVSLLPEGILYLKPDKEVALPAGFSDPNLINIIWNAAWLRKACGNTGRIPNPIQVKKRIWTAFKCLFKVCELGKEEDWKTVANLIEDPKFKSLTLLGTIEKLISINNIAKANELAEAIPEPEIKTEALNNLALAHP